MSLLNRHGIVTPRQGHRIRRLNRASVNGPLSHERAEAYRALAVEWQKVKGYEALSQKCITTANEVDRYLLKRMERIR